MDLLFIACAWTLFYTLHSLLASNTIKNLAAKKLGSAYKAYRLTYNVFNILFFILLIYLHTRITTVIVFEPIFALQVTGLALLLIGIIIGMFSFKNYSLTEFSGIQLLKSTNTSNTQLNTKGINKYVRHPLYLATISLLTGYWLLKPQATTTIFVLISLIYIYIGALLEEKKLIQLFGEQYTKYKIKTPMFFPNLRVRK